MNLRLKPAKQGFSPGREFLRKLSKQRVAMIALVVVLIIVGLGIAAPWLVPYDPRRPVISQYADKGIVFDHLYTDEINCQLLLSDGTTVSITQDLWAESANRRVASARAAEDSLVVTAINAGETYVYAIYADIRSALRVTVTRGRHSELLLSGLIPQAGAKAADGSIPLTVKGLMSDGSELTDLEELLSAALWMRGLRGRQDTTGGWGGSGEEEPPELMFEALTPETVLVTAQGQALVVGEGPALVRISLGDVATVINLEEGAEPQPVAVLFAKHDLQLIDVYKHQPPSARHWFGTDHQNRDIFSRVLMGTRQTLMIGFVSVGLGATLGTILGLLAGYYGGFLDNFLGRCCDVLLAFPGNLLAIAVIALLGTGLINIIVAVAVYTVPIFLRLVRGTTLSLKNMTYVEAARSIGVGDSVIIARHIFPGTISVVMVYLTMRIGMAILIGAALSFLGLGGDITAPEWGAMLSAAKDNSRTVFHPNFFPGLAIVITVLSFNLLGDGLRDALDPKLKD